MAKKLPKQNAQQAFNQFLFDTMMDKIRDIELFAKEINSLKVSDASTIGSFKSLFPRVERLEKMHAMINDHNKRLADHDESIEALSETVDQLSTCNNCHNFAALIEDRRRIEELEKELKNQRAHIIERAEENKAAHIQQSDTFMKMQKQIGGLENRLSRSQDMIAECHPSGCITVHTEANRIRNKSRLKTDTSCNDSERLYKGEPLKQDAKTKKAK
jgi:hypothetical protein